MSKQKTAEAGRKGIRPNTFPTPNEHVDYAMEMLTSDEYKVLNYSIRHTWGWHVDQNAMAVSMFTNGYGPYSGVGLSRATVVKCLGELSKYKFLIPVGKADADGQVWAVGLEPDLDGLQARFEEKKRQRESVMSPLRDKKKEKSRKAVYDIDRSTGKTESGLQERPKAVYPVDANKDTSQRQSLKTEKKLLASASANAPTPAIADAAGNPFSHLTQSEFDALSGEQVVDMLNGVNPFPVTEPTPTPQTAQGKANDKDTTAPSKVAPKVPPAARKLTKLEREIMTGVAEHPRSRVRPETEVMDCAANLCDEGLMTCEKIGGKAHYKLTDEGLKLLSPNPPIAPAPLSPKVNPAECLGRAYGIMPVGKKDWAAYGAIARDLIDGTVTVEEFPQYVADRKAQASAGNWRFTLQSLTTTGVISAWVAKRNARQSLPAAVPYAPRVIPLDKRPTAEQIEAIQARARQMKAAYATTDEDLF